MYNNSLFLSCLAISIAIHCSIFVVNPQGHYSDYTRQRIPMEVFYHDSPLKEITSPQDYTTKLPRKDTLPKIEKTALMNIKIMSEFIKREIFKETQQPTTVEKPLTKENAIHSKVKVNLPDISEENQRTPEYRSYYRTIREKIKRYAYANYKKLYEGEVFLSFILSSDGGLKETSINPQKSTQNEYLRTIAIKSVKEAAPYPKFPEKLKDKNTLSFRVVISFELK